ncbi:MAG: hypothetical protein IPM39_23930 [Chloroflexi bacterium]|nr:hypothetical protein [Chloroflexota bacterium]
MAQQEKHNYVICIQNDGADDLQLRKIYQVLPDENAAQDGYLRLIDDSGEDYLYPDSFFTPVTLSPNTVRAVFAAPVV